MKPADTQMYAGVVKITLRSTPSGFSVQMPLEAALDRASALKLEVTSALEQP
jgi:hypothetical protein